MKSERLARFEESRQAIIDRSQNADAFDFKLLFAHVVTAFEPYLSDLTLDLLKTEEKLMIELSKTDKFKAQKIPLSDVLKIDAKKYFLGQVSKITFHNLSEVEPIFRKAFGIRVTLTDPVLKSIKMRHHIVHRDGYTKEGMPISVDRDDLLNTLREFAELADEIDRQAVSQYPAIPCADG
jgi:hypothetical protein